MTVTSYYSKRAIKGTGGPIGFPQPVRWIDCGCGRCIPMPHAVDAPASPMPSGATCDCGTAYDGYGFILNPRAEG